MGERMTTEPRTETWVLVAALRELARTIASDDGVANAAIGEAADRLGVLDDDWFLLKAQKPIDRRLIAHYNNNID